MNRNGVFFNRMLLFLTSLLAVTAGLLIAAILYLLTVRTQTPTAPAATVSASVPVQAAEKEPSPPENAAPYYTVVLAENELQLFQSDKPDGYTVLRQIDPRTLRKADREKLEAGLRLSSREELAGFLEDFGS